MKTFEMDQTRENQVSVAQLGWPFQRVFTVVVVEWFPFTNSNLGNLAMIEIF